MKNVFIAAALAFACSTPGFAADTKAKTEVTKEQREKMAEHHEKMAACLRSDKSISDCHDEMRESCQADKGMCPGFDMGGKGRMRGMWRNKDAPAKN